VKVPRGLTTDHIKKAEGALAASFEALSCQVTPSVRADLCEVRVLFSDPLGSVEWVDTPGRIGETHNGPATWHPNTATPFTYLSLAQLVAEDFSDARTDSDTLRGHVCQICLRGY